MSTEFINDQWRLPNAWNGSESNVNKQSNYSMDFDAASSDYINFTGLPDFGDGSLTISFWIKSGVDSGQNYVLNRALSFYIFQPGTSTNLRYRLQTSGLNQINGGAILDSNWHHCVMTFDSSANEFKVFEDGSQVGSTVTTSGSLASSTAVVDFAYNGSGYYKSGQFDGLSFFDYALTDGTGGTVNQIAALYGSSSTGIGNPMSLSPKPVAYYPLGDQDAFNGASYLTPNSSLKDYVFSFTSNSKISAGNITSLNSVSNASYSFWFKATSSTGYPTAGALIGTANTSATTAYFYNNTLYIHTLYGGFITTSIPALNQWHHVCCTFNAGSSEAFINGVSVGTKTGEQSTTNANAGTDFSIGYSPNYNFYFVNGQISNVSLFNTTLPATGTESVQSLYNYGTPPDISSYSGLQGWWKLDASATYDGSNWTIPDDSTNSNTGTSSGMTQANLVQSDLSFTSGYSPYALNFDAASSDYIDTNLNLSYTVYPNISLSCWIKMDKANLNTWTSYNPLGVYVPLYANSSPIRILTNGVKKADIIVQGNGTSSTTTDLADGNWHHILQTCEYNSSGTICNVYVNGVKEITNQSLLSYSPLNGNLLIGSRTSSTWFFQGSLSNASIWNTALTQAQVTELYNEGVPSNLNNHSAYSNLVSWWQLGSNSSFNTNWTVLDEKGSNNGTSSNMTEDAIVDGVGSYANGLSSGMGGDEVIGDAPYSTANSLSVNMDVEDRVEDTPS